MNKFWLVWGDDGRAPTYKHFSLDFAKREAERLTRVHGGAFHVLEHVATCQRNDITWKDSVDEDEDPFAND